jgi:hypothetical protein
MKTSSRILLSVFLLAFLTCSITAQEKEALSSDLLKTKIEQFEKTDITSKSAVVQGIYQRTLLRLYNQYDAALKQEIADLKAMQAVVSGTNKESQNEIALQLQKLSADESVTSEKIRTLTGDLKSPGAQGQPAPPQVPRVVGGPSRARTDVNLPLTLDPRQVTGRVTTINEQIFTNAYEFTPDQLRRAVERVVSRRASGATPQQDDTPIDVPEIVEEGSGTPVKAHAVNTALQPPIRAKLYVKKNHIRDLETPLAEVNVKVEKPGDTNFTPLEFLTDYQGRYTTTALNDGAYVLSVKLGDFKTAIPVNIVNGAVAPPPPNLQLLIRPLGEFSRAIVGFEQAGASAAKSTQKYFFDLTLSHPLPFQKSVDPYFGPRGRMWGTVRVTSVPQQITSSVGTFATGFAQQVSEVKVNEVAQAAEFLAGVDVRLTNKFLSFGSFGGQTATKLTLSFIAGGGAITPFNPRETLEVFKAFPGAPGLPDLPAGTEFVAFVSPDRDRFFRQYYAGFRLQTHYFDYKNPRVPINRFPATLDITYGQNEAITGGRLRGGVIRLEGFYPLPYDELKFINLFGTALFRPIRTKITDPLILQLAPPDTAVPAANVFLITVPQINRDYYRVGVGIDFISFIKKLGAGQSK